MLCFHIPYIKVGVAARLKHLSVPCLHDRPYNNMATQIISRMGRAIDLALPVARSEVCKSGAGALQTIKYFSQ